MRIAVCLIGMSYYDGNSLQKRDWRNCVDNIKNFFKEIDVRYYITTYNSQFNDDIIQAYNPVKSLFLNIDENTQRGTYIKALNNVDDDVDFIICTRFDIFFNKNISDFNIDYNKFNFLFREKGNWDRVVNDINVRFVTDNFFAFPSKYKMIFMNVINNLDRSYYLKNNLLSHPLTFMHHVFDGSNPKLCDSVDYQFISDIQENSDINSFYKLYRGIKIN
jgi:hypothetical protein